MQILQAWRSNTKAAASLRFSVQTSSNRSWKSVWRISGARSIISNRNYSGAKIYRVHLGGGGEKKQITSVGENEGMMNGDGERITSLVRVLDCDRNSPATWSRQINVCRRKWREKNSEFLTWEGDKRLTSGGGLFLMMAGSDRGLLWDWVATEQGWRNSIKHH